MVCKVEPESLAEYLQIQPGDRIISVNGHKLRDEIDFRFYASEEEIILDIAAADGTEKSYEIEKDPDDLMGITFENPIFDGMKTCRNKCCFCFIDQLPRGLRKSLYVHDDDYRLSFLFGNFISLTNLSDTDWQRIGEQRLSPLRVSLHTSDPKARAMLMGNPAAAQAMRHLRRFKQMGIAVHVQIVLLKGLNDGRKLLRTLENLESLGNTVLSVGVVPAIYTRYRKVLPSPCGGPEWAGETLSILENYARKVHGERGVYWVYGADEFYFLSGREFPEYGYYDDFPQFENGIGMTVDFRETLKKVKAEFKPCTNSGNQAGKGKIVAVAGVMGYSEVVSAVNTLGIENRISVCKVRNKFFGDTVTCSGLLTGRDIVDSILGLKRTGEEFECVLIPSYSVFEGRFLDDMTIGDMVEITGLPVQVVEPSPVGLVDAVFESKGE